MLLSELQLMLQSKWHLSSNKIVSALNMTKKGLKIHLHSTVFLRFCLELIWTKNRPAKLSIRASAYSSLVKLWEHGSVSSGPYIYNDSLMFLKNYHTAYRRQHSRLARSLCVHYNSVVSAARGYCDPSCLLASYFVRLFVFNTRDWLEVGQVNVSRSRHRSGARAMVRSRLAIGH